MKIFELSLPKLRKKLIVHKIFEYLYEPKKRKRKKASNFENVGIFPPKMEGKEVKNKIFLQNFWTCEKKKSTIFYRIFGRVNKKKEKRSTVTEIFKFSLPKIGKIFF